MKVILIDDERLARRELRNLLKRFDHIEIIDECANADEAIASVKKNNPDLIFLDIQMPGKNGFDMLGELDKVPKVIFVTAYDEYAIRAFDVNALDYLLKPVDPKRLEEAVLRLDEQSAPPKVQVLPEKEQGVLVESDQIFLKDGEKCWFVTLSDVRMFESEGNYVRVYFNEHKPLILKSLNNLETRLDTRTFFRANRKYIINLRWVDTIENWFNGGLLVKLKNENKEEKVEISRRQASRFKDLMSL